MKEKLQGLSRSQEFEKLEKEKENFDKLLES